MTEHWHRLPSQAVDSPSLEILKKSSGHDPEQPSLADPAWSRGVKFDDRLRSLPTSAIPCFYTILYAFRQLKLSQRQSNGEAMSIDGCRDEQVISIGSIF